MTKEEVIAAILAYAKLLGRAPSRTELSKRGIVSRRTISKHFGTYNRALEECQLEAKPGGRKLDMADLFRDWAGIARKLSKIPTQLEYERHSKYSIRPLIARVGGWADVPKALRQYAEEQGMQPEWKDVLELIEQEASRRRCVPGLYGPPYVPRSRTDQPMYGQLLCGCPLVFAPTNEAAVLFLFGAMAERLGFLALRIQTAFPDCEAMRAVGDGRLQRVRIEIEQESRNFLVHGHDPAGCEMIVCWEHNWLECPLEVLELKSQLPTAPSTAKWLKLEEHDIG